MFSTPMGRNSLRAVFAFAFFATIMLAVPALPGAFAHGGHQPPPFDFGGKKASLFVKLDPPIVASAGDPVFITARFFDENTNENFKEVNYRIYFEKDGEEIPIETSGGEFGGQGFFYDPDGSLVLKIIPKDTPTAVAKAEAEEPIWRGVWSFGQPVIVEGPIFTEPGLYNLFVEIVTVGTSKNQVDEGNPPKFDVWVTPGREEMIEVTDEQSIKVRNYYGAIAESDYDDSTKTISFSMPFDWESDLPTRIGMLHTEVFIPKELSDFDHQSLRGTVNGFGVPVFVDNYGDEEIIVHYTISRKNLEDLQGKIKAESSSPQDAVFALSPPDPESEVRVMQVASESPSYSVSLTIPEQIFPQQPVPFGVRISDKQGNPVSSATYELVIEDGSGNVLSRSGGSTTPEGLSSQDVNFDAQGSFTVRVEKINATNESVQSSIQVVPEFPVAALAASLGIAGAVAYGRFRGFFNRA